MEIVETKRPLPKLQEYYIKDRVYIKVDYECWMECEVTEVRKEFGRVRYTVVPVAGSGEMKVERIDRKK